MDKNQDTRRYIQIGSLRPESVLAPFPDTLDTVGRSMGVSLVDSIRGKHS